MKNVVSSKYQPIKDDAALHGKTIGHIGKGVEVTVDETKEHDRWVPIVGPAGLGPVWKESGKQGWIKVTNFTNAAIANKAYEFEINSDGEIVSFNRTA